MEGLCSKGQLENAECCCSCKFPLLVFCKKHAQEHQVKDPGQHFILPLSVVLAIPSKQVHYEVQDWLINLKVRFAALREKLDEFAARQDQIQVVYKEIKQDIKVAQKRLQEQFSVAKTAFGAAIENAIIETSDHALDTQWFVPSSPLSQLLWYNDPGAIATYQAYVFQANSAKEYLSAAFQVALHFTVPGFEHLEINQSTQVSSLHEEELMKVIALKEESHSRELDELRKTLKDETTRHAEDVHQLENTIQELRLQLQIAHIELQDLRSDEAGKDQHSSTLQKESVAAQLKVLTTDLETWSQQIRNQASELESLRTRNSDLEKDRDSRIAELHQQIFQLKQEKITLAQQLKHQVAATGPRISVIEEGKPGIQVEECKFPAPAEPLQKLIAVLTDKIQCFDETANRWQQLCNLRSSNRLKRFFQSTSIINVDNSTASTFIASNRIFACGGGDKPCTCHVGNCAYVLQADNGSVQELPHMSKGRGCHGVAWDSERKALYVFGGFDGHGTCYTGNLLRASERNRGRIRVTGSNMTIGLKS